MNLRTRFQASASGGGGADPSQLTQGCFPLSRWLATEIQEQRAGEEWQEDGGRDPLGHLLPPLAVRPTVTGGPELLVR